MASIPAEHNPTVVQNVIRGDVNLLIWMKLTMEVTLSIIYFEILNIPTNSLLW